MSNLWYPTVKESPMAGVTGMTGGVGGLNFHHAAAAATDCGPTSGSVDFGDQSSVKYLSVADNTVMDNVGTGNFTLECFWKCTSFGGWQCMAGKYNSSCDCGVWLHGYGSSNIAGGDQGNNWILSSSLSLSENTWYHIALVRNGTGSNNVTLYHNGTSVGSVSSDSRSVSNGENFEVARLQSLNRNWKGKISNVRYTKQALYTSNFTKPSCTLTTTSQGATASNVMLLCCTSTSSTTATVANTTGQSLTASGSPSASSDQPF
tara:strand:- start:535 stop:1320 length:786 start_codon:yes stop_codon:yes gene_type:complete